MDKDISWEASGKCLLYIDKDGILHLNMELSDENARRFIEILENNLNRKITGIDYENLES